MRLRATIVALFALALGACGSDAVKQTAATVNGETISISEVSRALDRFEETVQFEQLAQQGDESSAKRQFEQAYLAQQIRRAVLRPAAAELGVEVTDAQVQDQLDQIKSQFSSEKEFEKALADRGFTALELDELIRDEILQGKIRAKVTEDTAASQEEVRDYYESRAEVYKQTKVQHILVNKGDLAGDISNRLQGAPGDRVDELFAKLAKRYSTDSSNKNSAGELGWVSPGSLVAEFEEAMDSLEAGEVSDPVQTDFGVHVIRVTGRRQQPYSRVADEIEARLSGTAAEDAYTEWLKNAYEEAGVEVNPRYGELDPSTGQITNATSADVPGADDSSPAPAG
jgi:foldase protein PrsA